MPRPGAVEIALTKGKSTIVDAQDYDLVMAAGTWSAQINPKTIYAYRYGDRKVYLHRFLMAAPMGIQVDHINGNGLDNRRANLRLASASQNQANVTPPANNTSGFKGVWRPKGRRLWVATIYQDRRKLTLGSFEDPADAARAYDAAARELFGEFARLNFPEMAAE